VPVYASVKRGQTMRGNSNNNAPRTIHELYSRVNSVVNKCSIQLPL